MSIQMNLLPKVKLDYIEANRTKKFVSFIAFIATGSAVGILLILFFAVNVVQTKYSKDLSKDITSESNKLKNITELDKVLTIQNQLDSLKTFHDSKPVASRLFSYIASITPNNVSITDLTIDFATKTIDIKGTADSINTINIYVDTMKFTNYKTSDSPAQTGIAFTNVVLDEFGKADKDATYNITATFADIIFSSAQDIKLEVPPGKITTRSETEKPTKLFKLAPDIEGAQ